ncbi:hypothetical protein K439DRAFT_1664441 [Ramaria rubella]|nr:hypothetical protein K439DRAFT_1664441 [Ramaria rubella]
MTSLGPGRTNFFVLDPGGFINWSYNYGGPKAWVPYHHNASGPWRFEPVTISRALGELSVFTVARDNALHQSNFDLVNDGDLGPWVKLGGNLLGVPVIANQNGTLHIFFVEDDHVIRHKTWNGVVHAPKDGYEKIIGNFEIILTAASAGPDEVSLFSVNRMDDTLYHYRWVSGSGWSPSEKLPGTWNVTSLKAVSAQPGCLDVFGIVDGNLNHVFCSEYIIHIRDLTSNAMTTDDEKKWKFQAHSGIFVSLDVITSAPGVINLFALGNQQTIFHRALENGSWHPWDDLKGTMIRGPKAVCQNKDVLAVFSVGTNSHIYYKFKETRSGFWSEWVDTGFVASSAVG